MDKLIKVAGVAGAAAIVEAAAGAGPLGVLALSNPAGLVVLGGVAVVTLGAVTVYAISKGKNPKLGPDGFETT